MVYVFFADGFEEIEALAPVDLMRRAGLDVRTVGVTGKTVTGSHKIPVVCDLTVEEVSGEGLEAVVLPGGMPGTLNLEKSLIVQKIIDQAVANDKWIAAICAAPSILGHKGLLEGREAICFPGFEGELRGAEISKSYVCQDGRFVTAKGAGAAVEFGLKLVELLVGAQQAAALKESIQCPA